MSNFMNLLPKKLSPEVILVQARVEKNLVQQAKNVMKRNRYTWSEILTACLKQLVEENTQPAKQKKFSK